MFEAIGDLFNKLLLPLSVSNIVVLSLIVAIIGLVVLLFISPDLDASLNRGVRSGQDSTTSKLLRQVRTLRTSARGVREESKLALFYEGSSSRPINTAGDFFKLVRVAGGLGAGVFGLILGIGSANPLFLLLGVIGYLLPSFVASRYNRGRRKKIMAQVPQAMQRLQTRIAAGAEIREAFAKAAQRRTGPLYAEMLWAARQMAIPGNNQYDILREIDVRNNLPPLFVPVADQMERASRRSAKDAREVLLAYIDRILEDEDAKRQAKISSLANKVTVGMVPFLIAGLALALGGPFAATLINGPVR